MEHKKAKRAPQFIKITQEPILENTETQHLTFQKQTEKIQDPDEERKSAFKYHEMMNKYNQ